MRLVGPGPSVDDDAATKQYVDAATAPKLETVVVDFGEDDTTAAGVGFAEWVTADSAIVCVPDPAGTPDHSAEEAGVEGVAAMVTYVEPGIGFDVLAVCPGGTWGRYSFICKG